MLATIQGLALAIPGANYVLLGLNFLQRYWKPIAIAVAVAYSFHAGVVHERKANNAAQLRAQLVKVTFERDNLVKAAQLANIELDDLSNIEAINRRLTDAFKSQRPAASTCRLSADVIRRLQSIGTTNLPNR